MVAITSLTPGAAAAQANPAAKSNLDYDAFLKLLVAQMKNQDPTKPMDSTEYIAQLASFSNVEQSIKLNAKLDDLILETQLAQGASLIGKYVSSLDGDGEGVVESVRFTVNGVQATLADGTDILINDRVTIANDPG